MAFNWTPERIAQLDRYWNIEMLSATTIARKFGDGLSRCAVIGKVSRLKLSKRPPCAHGTGTRNEREADSRRVQCTMLRMPKVQTKVRTKPVHIPEPVFEPSPNRCHIMELSATTCRWPMGDPRNGEQFHFCGKTPVDESPYCNYHHRIAYQPVVSRKRYHILTEQRALSSR